jgi:hypothetical protein
VLTYEYPAGQVEVGTVVLLVMGRPNPSTIPVSAKLMLEVIFLVYVKLGLLGYDTVSL